MYFTIHTQKEELKIYEISFLTIQVFAYLTVFINTRAEIVFHGEPREESNRRQEGKLAVSLASISGVNAHDLLHSGDTVAIIDCQTFVPGDFF